MNRFDMERVGRFTKGLGEIVGCCLLIAASYIKLKNDKEKSGSYDGAVEAIMGSSMFSSDKCEAVRSLKQGERDEYYKSVISVMQSSMFGSEKVRMIKYLSEK